MNSGVVDQTFPCSREVITYNNERLSIMEQAVISEKGASCFTLHAVCGACSPDGDWPPGWVVGSLVIALPTLGQMFFACGARLRPLCPITSSVTTGASGLVSYPSASAHVSPPAVVDDTRMTRPSLSSFSRCAWTESAATGCSAGSTSA